MPDPEQQLRSAIDAWNTAVQECAKAEQDCEGTWGYVGIPYQDAVDKAWEKVLEAARNIPPGEPSEDPLLNQAVDIVIETGRASVSLLQRRLALGYTRASALIDRMGTRGIIGPFKKDATREVTMSAADWEAEKARAKCPGS